MIEISHGLLVRAEDGFGGRAVVGLEVTEWVGRTWCRGLDIELVEGRCGL